MRTAITPARCPDCDRIVTPPAGASGPTTARCAACGYVLLLFTPRVGLAPPAARRDAPWRRSLWPR
jgi:hypothetical protein